MRMLTLTSSYPRFPGDAAGAFVRSLVLAQRARGHEVTVLAPDEPLADHAAAPGEGLHHFRYAPRTGWLRMGYGHALEDDRRLRRSAYALIPAYLAAGTIALLRLARAERPDLLHCHWVIPNGPIAALVSRMTGVPLAITLHGSDVYVAQRFRPAGLLAGAAFRQAAFVTACSPDLAEGAAALGAAPERTTVLPWGVDAARFGAGDGPAWRARHGIAADAPLILAAGRLVAKKGFSHLMDAAPRVLAAHPNARFVIGGDGALLAPLRAQARRLGVASAVMLPGAIPWPDMPHALAAADLFAAPSVQDADGNLDGLPTVILEAMGAGRPVVASRIAGIPLAVEHEATGLLTPPGDVNALADAILELLSCPERRRTLGDEARRRTLTDLSWDRVAERFDDLCGAAGITL
ncbi:MAG: glycosyltransferase [Chloroflexi bacterium]|nr:glycosyltransferase [Chloroflexota bacterium]